MSYSPCGGTSNSGPAAQKLAIAALAVALLMFGIRVHENKLSHQAQMISPPVAAPAPAAAFSNSVNAPLNDDEDEAKAARRAVTDALREKFPGAKIDGIFLLPLTRDGSAFFARADSAVGEGRRVLPALVCRYTRRGGATYWRAEPLGRDEAAARLAAAEGNGMGAGGE